MYVDVQMFYLNILYVQYDVVFAFKTVTIVFEFANLL